MRPNLFSGFRKFCEDKSQYVNTMKSQIPISLNAIYTQPILVPAGQFKFEEPTWVYVIDQNENSVTLSTIPPHSITHTGTDWDADREIETKARSPRNNQTFIVSVEEFKKLVEPPAASPQGAGGGMGGGMGGLGL